MTIAEIRYVNAKYCCYCCRENDDENAHLKLIQIPIYKEKRVLFMLLYMCEYIKHKQLELRYSSTIQ